MKQNPHQKVIQQYGADKIIELLQNYISEARKTKIENVLDQRLENIHLAIECPADIHNAFAAIRTGEIFGVPTVHIITPEVSIPTGKMISKGAIKWVEVFYYENIDNFFNNMATQGIQVAGALPKGKDTLSALPIHQPLCLLFGNENRGLSAEAQKLCDWHYQIPMYGMTASLNLSVAAAISLYETTRRKREFLQKNGELDIQHRKNLQARFYLNSVDPRIIKSLIR